MRMIYIQYGLIKNKELSIGIKMKLSERIRMKNIVTYIKYPRNIIDGMLNHHFFDWLPDNVYLRFTYFIRMRKVLHLKNPKTFNEKLQWLKLYDRNIEYTKMVDKAKVKQYAARMIGEQYIIPTLGVWGSLDEIEFDKLPNEFVLKCTHDSGGVIICKDKAKLDIKKIKREMGKALKSNYYLSGREWPYKNVRPCIIAEKFIADEMQDYKLFCFNGVPKITLVCSERFSDTGLKEDFFNMNWKHLNMKRSKYPNSEKIIKKPIHYEKMKEYAARLAKNIPFVRVDFYEINGELFFGEITFFPASGFEGFEPERWDLKLGSWICLPDVSKKVNVNR